MFLCAGSCVWNWAFMPVYSILSVVGLFHFATSTSRTRNLVSPVWSLWVFFLNNDFAFLKGITFFVPLEEIFDLMLFYNVGSKQGYWKLVKTSFERLPLNRYEKQLEQEEQSLQQQRRRLYNEVAEEKERLNQQAARWEKACWVQNWWVCWASRYWPFALTKQCSGKKNCNILKSQR